MAYAYKNRGIAHKNQGALDAAMKDFNNAIALWESLQAVLEPQGK